MIGWGFVPSSITTLHFLGGTLTNSNTELMSLALPNLEEVNVFLPATDHNNKKTSFEIGKIGIKYKSCFA